MYSILLSGSGIRELFCIPNSGPVIVGILQHGTILKSISLARTT